MKLTELIKLLDVSLANPGLVDFEIEGVSCNSKNISDNFVFVAIAGTNEDGHRFIEEAVRCGARAVITSREVSAAIRKEIPVILVKDTRRALAKVATEFYGNPSKKIKVVGITGTNGKTTVSYLVEAILRQAQQFPAVIGTIEYRFKDKKIPSRNTTPGPIELQSMLADMLKDGINYAVMEVSSHALDQNRIEGINFHSAIFTNLTQDHLDYHRTQEDYFQAKAKLFRNMNSNSFAVINNDDAYAQRIKELTSAHKLTYGIKKGADVLARDIKFDIRQMQFLLTLGKRKIDFKSQLIGCHNVYNILAAVAWARQEGLDLTIIKSAIEKFNCVPGRLEKIDFEGDFSVFVDYAHTEDALTNVIKTLRCLSSGEIIVVFGCGGQRDKTKRPRMGRVVSELADYAIITNDNPRREDPDQIIEDIKKGINQDNYCVIPDRKEAIRKSLSLAKRGDILLVAGKGHENYQILKDLTIPFDDREVLKECLQSKSY
jgi:UDP-N-acetylmuramoyl-L-alanyl-D-glutamate--2,6-diaminopimelate ligase